MSAFVVVFFCLVAGFASAYIVKLAKLGDILAAAREANVREWAVRERRGYRLLVWSGLPTCLLAIANRLLYISRDLRSVAWAVLGALAFGGMLGSAVSGAYAGILRKRLGIKDLAKTPMAPYVVTFLVGAAVFYLLFGLAEHFEMDVPIRFKELVVEP